jgi:hypothetical protein
MNPLGNSATNRKYLNHFRKFHETSKDIIKY